MPKIIIEPNRQRKRPPVRRERKNVFSDETNLYLLRFLRRVSAPANLHGANLHGANLHGADLQRELADAIRQRILPWFWSVVLHGILLIILALILFPVIRLEPLDMLSGMVSIPMQHDVSMTASPEQEVESRDEGRGESEPQPEYRESNGAWPSDHGTNSRSRDFVEDEAVLAGLRWLVRVQQPSGAWHFSGPFPQSAIPDRDDALAATAMALLAFQGAGRGASSPANEFARPVRRGWDWLLRQQNPDGSFVSPSASDTHRFYTHGLCTIALCKLLVMTGDDTLQEPAQRAIDYCIRHQSIRSGGWRYLPDRYSDQSDVSVTGWIVLALKSGEAAGLTIPAATYNNVMKFLDSMMVGNQYRYREEEPEPRLSMTAEALLCRMLLGWKRGDSRLAAGVQLILDSPPSFTDYYRRDVYYWYFATQTLYHYGGPERETWNAVIREQLVQHQERVGAESGSWNPYRPVRDSWGTQYGRLYTTCMSLSILARTQNLE